MVSPVLVCLPHLDHHSCVCVPFVERKSPFCFPLSVSFSLAVPIHICIVKHYSYTQLSNLFSYQSVTNVHPVMYHHVPNHARFRSLATDKTTTWKYLFYVHHVKKFFFFFCSPPHPSKGFSLHSLALAQSYSFNEKTGTIYAREATLRWHWQQQPTPT